MAVSIKYPLVPIFGKGQAKKIKLGAMNITNFACIAHWGKLHQMNTT